MDNHIVVGFIIRKRRLIGCILAGLWIAFYFTVAILVRQGAVNLFM